MTQNNQQVKDHFNIIAPKYDNYKRKNSLYYQTLKQAVKNCINTPNTSILDIGCGTGDMLSFLNPKVGIGIDVSPKMIDQAKSKYKNNSNVRFYTHDIEHKAYLGKFDYIVFTDVIEHVVDKEKAIKNISLSMNHKTSLILSMANPFWEPILMILEKLRFKMPEGPHQRISEKGLYRILQKYNLTILTKDVYFPMIPFPLTKNLGLIYIYKIKIGR